MNPRRAFLVVFGLLLVGVGIAWAVQEYRQQMAMQRAIREAPAALRAYTADWQPVRFVRAEGSTMIFSWPEQVERNGEKFIEYVEHSGTMLVPEIGHPTQPPTPLAELRAGQELRVDLETDPTDPSRYIINAAFIVP